MGVKDRMSAVALAGGATSAALTLYVGRHNPSPLLIALFVLWVLSPFAALILAARWNGTALQATAFAVALASVAIYAWVALFPPRTPAFAFLAVPGASWVLVAVVFSTARRR